MIALPLSRKHELVICSCSSKPVAAIRLPDGSYLCSCGKTLQLVDTGRRNG